MARETQGTPCHQNDLMMIDEISIYLCVFFYISIEICRYRSIKMLIDIWIEMCTLTYTETFTNILTHMNPDCQLSQVSISASGIYPVEPHWRVLIERNRSLCGCQYICFPTLVGLSSLAREVMVDTSIKQGSSNELSSRQPLSGYM